MNFESYCSKSKLQGRYYDRGEDHLQSHFWRDTECYYYHKKGHMYIIMYYKQLKKYLKAMKQLKSEETSNFNNIVNEDFDKKVDLFLL